jgi:hypothetical protein
LNLTGKTANTSCLLPGAFDILDIPRGWKKVEYEVVRDADNNCTTVCNAQNFGF